MLAPGDYQKIKKKLFEKMNSRNINLQSSREGFICYASKANSFLIRSDGRIGKCTVALNDERNNIGRLHDDGSMDVDSHKISPWLRGIKRLDPHVLSCPYESFSDF